MSSFLNLLSEDGCVNFEQCGDVVVSTKDNMIGMFCHFCSDIYTNLLEFLHHLQWMHNDILNFANVQNVYTVEELLSMPSPQEDVQSQAESITSADSGIPVDIADAAGVTCVASGVNVMIETESESNIANNADILNALAAYDVEFKKSKANMTEAASKSVLEWQAEADKCLPAVAALEAPTKQQRRDVLAEVQAMLFGDEENVEQSKRQNLDTNHDIAVQKRQQDIDLKHEQNKLDRLEDNLDSDDIKSENPIKPTYSKVNHAKKCLKRYNSKPAETLQKSERENLNKCRNNLNLNSYAIARSARKREHQQRLSNIKKRILRSLENETPKQASTLKKAKVQPFKQLKLNKISSSTLPNKQEELRAETVQNQFLAVVTKSNDTETKISPTENNISIKEHSDSFPLEQIKAIKDKSIQMSKTIKFTAAAPPKKQNTVLEPIKESLIKPSVDNIKIEQMSKMPIINSAKESHSGKIRKQTISADVTLSEVKSPIKNNILKENVFKVTRLKDEKVSTVLVTKVENLPPLNLNLDKSKINKRPSYFIDEAKSQTQQTDLQHMSSPIKNSSQSPLIRRPIRSSLLNADNIKQSKTDLVEPEPIKREQTKTLKQGFKRPQAEINTELEEKRTKKDKNSSFNFDLSDSVVEFLERDLKSSQLSSDSLLRLAEPNEERNSNVFENILNEVVVEQNLKENKPTNIQQDNCPRPTIGGSNEIEVNDLLKDKLRDDFKLLELVGLRILKEPNCEDFETVEFCDVLRSKAEKFTKLLRSYGTAWNPRKLNVQFRHKLQKELTMLAEDINNEFKINLNVKELKRILNLINAWHTQQIDLKFFKKLPLSSSIEHYLQLFAFLPKISRWQYYCEWCEESCINKTRYEKHRLMHLHKFSCQHCKRGFIKRGYLNNHVRTVHNMEN